MEGAPLTHVFTFHKRLACAIANRH
ncbi:hypothetical protein SAMN05192583_2472 [Sphingomonas gellani]|uniref:Uncharacterized protein n=1 Tax=Sphingomonas gellani TaxID=1166340 RepID=A0A1H8FKT6_9SPHN|nr:hypothetical protein SAMN05192583_2472 [Sphingomonas gellani]